MPLREHEIIQTLARTLKPQDGFSDDVFFHPASRQVLTTDLLVEGRHFSLDYFSPEDLGWKAMAINLSDLASIGAVPEWMLVSLGLRDELSNPDWVQRLYNGMLELLATTGGEIVGGDTVGSDQTVINITATGRVPENCSPGFRFAAQPGDIIVTSGFSGLSVVGLEVLRQKLDAHAYPSSVQVHLRPMPRVEYGYRLSRLGNRLAMTDSSDGLADALLKIAMASGVRMVVAEAAIPVHPEVSHFYQEDPVTIRKALLYGGEDFELVACLPRWDESLSGVFAIIGKVEQGDPGAYLIDQATQAPLPLSLNETYAHFTQPDLVP